MPERHSPSSGSASFWQRDSKLLKGRKQEINDLNVYPVPDGDTGTNLALTVRGMLDAASGLPQDLPAGEP